MALPAFARVAGMALLQNQVHQGRAAQFFGQFPGSTLAQPHQRRVQDKAAVHAQIERHLHGLDAVVAAVRIAGKIALADAQYQMADILGIGPDGGVQDEQQVAARHKGGGQTARPVGGDGRVGSQGRVGQLAENIHIQQSIRSQTGSPERIKPGQARAQALAAGQFHAVALAVVKAEGQNALEAAQRPGQAGGGILPAGKDDQSLLLPEESGGRDGGAHGCAGQNWQTRAGA